MTLAGGLRLGIVLAAVAALEIGCRAGLVPATSVIAPSLMVGGMVHAFAGGAIWGDLAATAFSVLVSVVLAVAGGFALGFVLHAMPPLRRFVEPLLAVYYAVPTFAFYPLLIVLFGLGVGPLMVLGTMYGIVAMLAGTILAFDRVPPVMQRTARVFGMNRLAALWHIRLPAAMPYLFSGVKLAIAYCFIGVIAGEFILSTRGIGHQIAFAYDNFDTPTMYGLILFVLVVVGGVNLVLHAREQRLMRTRTNA